MKKFKLLVLLVLTLAVALFSFTSCDQIKDLAGNVPGLDKLIDKLPGGEDEHVHAFGDATCTAPKTCECGATEGEPLGHNFVDGKCACGATDPNYVPETPEHTHNFVDGKCECGESDPNYVPPHTHEFVNGKCECGEIDPDYVPETPGESANVEITVDSLGVATQMYSAGTATIGGVNFEFVQIGNYGDGIQVRDKDGKTSMLWNTTAFKSPIAKIVLVYSDTKDVSYANPDAEIFSFGNEAKGATYTVKLSTTAGVKNYEIVPDAETYTYLYFEHDLGYTFYWKSITIVLADGSTVTPDTPEHTHNFVDGKCECGETDPNYVPPHTHEFVNGKCECGESDPNYVPETPTVNEYKVATTIKAGDHVLIAAHAHGKLLSVKKVSTYYNLGVNYSDTDFTNVTDDEIFVVGVDENGNYTFTSLSGKVIAMAASNNSLNDTGVNTGWVLEAKSDGIFYVKNAVRGTYLEWYASKNNWSTYYNDKSDLFEISFYVKSAGSTDTPDTPEHTHNFVDGKCECGESDPNYVPPHT
ncbi:MAG: hypothetical protein E7673_06600, partial [Ruminococcaceae bacterium]|nr:hypothetical protein [Oscillospiraceae bacterium]